MRKGLLIGAGACVFLGSMYSAYTFSTSNKPPTACEHCAVGEEYQQPKFFPNDRTKSIYNNLSQSYDSKVNFDEWLIGVTKLRKQVINEHIRGPRVLEIAAGTGRNLDFIVDRVRKDSKDKSGEPLMHLDVTDYSPNMIQQAYVKYKRMEKKQKFKYDGIQFKLADAHNLDLPERYYDTVFDTYGLCSFENPEQVLREMVKVCKDDGQIILLEHGRVDKRKTWFYHNWLNRYLDKTCEARAKNWGCWWNRDIEQIVNNCNDVLEVTSQQTHQFGTCYLIIGKPIRKNEADQL